VLPLASGILVGVGVGLDTSGFDVVQLEIMAKVRITPIR